MVEDAKAAVDPAAARRSRSFVDRETVGMEAGSGATQSREDRVYEQSYCARLNLEQHLVLVLLRLWK